MRRSGQQLRFAGLKSDTDCLNGVTNNAAVYFLNRRGSYLVDRRRHSRCAFVAVEHLKLRPWSVELHVYNNIYRYSLSNIGIGNDQNLFVIQNSRKGEHSPVGS